MGNKCALTPLKLIPPTKGLIKTANSPKTTVNRKDWVWGVTLTSLLKILVARLYVARENIASNVKKIQSIVLIISFFAPEPRFERR